MRAACGALLALSIATMNENAALAGEPVSSGLPTAAGAGRYLLADKTELFLAGLDAASSAAVDDALVRPGEALWPQVMAGALQVRHESGDDGETLWFNPVFDAGLLIHWRRLSGAWTAVDARWVLGSQIRNEPSSATSLPIGDADSKWRPDQLAETALRVFQTASAAGWAAPAKAPASTTEVLRRAKAAATSLAAFRSAEGLGEWAARRILVHEDPRSPDLDANLARALARFGPDARASLRAISAYHQGSGRWTLVLQSPDAPAVAWFVHFDQQSGGSTQIVGIDMVNYAGVEARQ